MIGFQSSRFRCGKLQDVRYSLYYMISIVHVSKASVQLRQLLLLLLDGSEDQDFVYKSFAE